MTSPSDVPERSTTVDGTRPTLTVRFDRTTRLVHWSNATLVIVLMVTGAFMFVPQLSGLLDRTWVRYTHIACGLAFPVPIVVGLLGRRGARLRADLRRLNRWSRPDWRWLRSFGQDTRGLGKFNAGQKLNAAVLGGALSVMFVSGLVMFQSGWFAVDTRTASTFTHDAFAYLVWLFVVGHILKALNEPEAFASMRRGTIPTAWVERHRPAWYAELERRRHVPGESSEAAPPRSLP